MPELAVSLLWTVFEAETAEALGTDADCLVELATDPSTEADPDTDWVAEPDTNEAVGAEAVSLLWTVFEAEATEALGTEADCLEELATDPSTEADPETDWVAEPETNEAVGTEAVLEESLRC